MAEAALIPKECVVCHGRFSAKRHSAKYCSERCRKRAQRMLESPLPPAAVMSAPVVALPRRESGEAGLLRSTERALEDAERLDTPRGQAVLLLARILDSGVQDTGSSIAALIRGWDDMFTKAMAGAVVDETPLQKIRRERELKAG